MARNEQLAIYLLKEGITADDALEEAGGAQEHAVSIGGRNVGRLLVKPTSSSPPRWKAFFAGSVEPAEIRAYNASTAAVLLTEAGGRTFAVTFGHGRHLLKPGTWEERFGLKVTLNSIDPNRLRSIDKKTFDAVLVHSLQQTSKEVSALEFGLDVEQDLLRAVTSTPTDTTLGKRLTGKDALSAFAEVDLENLPSLLERYLQKFFDTTYQTSFPWVDQIAELTDPLLREQLDAMLIARFRAGGDERLWLAVPDILPWQKTGGLRYTESTRLPLLEDIHVSTFLQSLRKPEDLDLDTLRQKRVYAFSSEGDHVSEKWPLYQCVYFEVDRDGQTFLLNGGKWYRVQQEFVRHLDAYISNIPRADDLLPPYHDPVEKVYNARVAAASSGNLALLDDNPIIYGGSGSRIEFCDLYSQSRYLIHVKRYGGSSSLSHLFSQGLTSIELFLTDPEFRRALNAKLPSSHKLSDPLSSPVRSDYTVAFGIVTRSAKPLVLPLFSKINLRHAHRRISGLGAGLCLIRIPVETR